MNSSEGAYYVSTLVDVDHEESHDIASTKKCLIIATLLITHAVSFMVGGAWGLSYGEGKRKK